MANIHSLINYIEVRHYSTIYEAVSKHLTHFSFYARSPFQSNEVFGSGIEGGIAEAREGIAKRYCKTEKRRNNSERTISLVSMEIKDVQESNSVGDNIYLRVIVEAKISLGDKMCQCDYALKSDKVSYGTETETKIINEWLRIPLIVKLRDIKSRKFSIGKPEAYSEKTYNQEISNRRRLTPNRLVPIIAKNNFDDIAQVFLSEFYPEALENPVLIDVEEVVRRMGLAIHEVKLSNNFSVSGAMVFNDCEIEIWNDTKEQFELSSFKGGTMLIDPDIRSMRNYGSYRNTVIHECIHWYLHRKYHWLRSVYDSDALVIRCQADKSANYDWTSSFGTQKSNIKSTTETTTAKSTTSWTDLDWMEWQANGIAPRIIMPKKQTLEIIERIKKRFYYMNMWERVPHTLAMQAFIGHLANFFGVSVMAAKIRLMDLGFRDIEGILTYVNDQYIEDYQFNVDSKDRNQTYCISLEDSLRLQQANKNFRNVVNSGKFVYVDGHYVLDNSNYVVKRLDGTLALTGYAKKHVDECCLRFNLVINTRLTATYDGEHNSVIFKDATPEQKRIPHFNKDKHNMELFNRDNDLKKFYYEISEEIHFAYEAEQTFTQYVRKIIKQKGMNRQVFQDKTLLSSSVYDRIKNDALETNPKIETAMSICIGLSLSGSQAEKLLEKAGHKLNDSPLHIVYKNFLYSLRGRTIYEYNEILGGLGLPPLSKKHFVEMQTR